MYDVWQAMTNPVRMCGVVVEVAQHSMFSDSIRLA